MEISEEQVPASQVNLFPLNTSGTSFLIHFRYSIAFGTLILFRLEFLSYARSSIITFTMRFFPLTQSWKKKMVEAFKEIVWKVTKTIHAKNNEWKSQFGFFYCVQLYLRLKSWINFNLVGSNFVWHLDKNVIFNVLRTIINFLENIAKTEFWIVWKNSISVEHIGWILALK